MLYDFERPEPAITVEELSVSFKTTHEKHATLRGQVARMLKRGKKTGRTIDALKSVTFEVPRGAVYGVVGRNGAGKSTLFRVLAGVYTPDAGRVTIAGRVTPLLSLGLGFNREITGRENILLGGLTNGLPTELIQSRYDEIIEFADIGAAIDYPMRTYSSGMFARVGFVVAAFLDPEIMLIDEALAAGDAVFRGKCMEKLGDLCTGADTTVVIITHGLGMVKLLASRALWLDSGEIRAEGEAEEIVDLYLDEVKPDRADEAAFFAAANNPDEMSDSDVALEEI